MILKKPYAFLIKHFKLIHLILLAPLCYLAYKSSNIYSFFNTLVGNNYITNEVNIAANHISIFVYLSIILIVGSAIAIYYLMKQKNKQTIFYAVLIIYYSLLFIWMSITYSQLFTLENHDPVETTVRTFRDFSQVIYLSQYIFIFFTLFRGIGFDLKNFNFSKDLEELELEDEDEEEIEISFGKNSYKYKRGLRKFIRELRYYILENKFVFSCIVAFTFIVIGAIIYTNIEVYNKKYSLNQPFAMNGLTVTLKDSILTNLNYDGTIISEGKYYLAVKVEIENKTDKPIKLNPNDFRIYIDKKFIYPKLDKTGKFIDYGDVYYGGDIKAKSKGEYVFVYELTEKQYKKKYTLKVLDSIVYKPGELHPKYRIVSLTPSIQTEIINIGKASYTKKINLEDTNIGNATFQINDYEINKTFQYQYQKCIGDNCKEYTSNISTSANTYLILDVDINIGEDSFYARNSSVTKDFITDFVTLTYEYGGKYYEEKLINKTPEKYTGKLMVFQVPKSLENAKNKELIITIRNKKAIIKLDK